MGAYRSDAIGDGAGKLFCSSTEDDDGIRDSFFFHHHRDISVMNCPSLRIAAPTP